ncbi:MAG TPA: membrane dipeptidase, partial [Xanthobacteraceae bacterium]|nr:membrane dipeptidase [Xanthobacteraceae bacterium]
LIDTHVDTIQRAVDLGHDLVHANPSGFMDLERMKAGNMTAAFFAVCVDYNNIRRGTGRQRQDTLLHAVLKLCRENPDKIGLAKTASDVRRLAREGKLAAILSVEGAQAIEERLELLPELWDHGVRSIAPAHFTSNGWADSSADEPRHGGLSALGRRAIAEINRLGMIIDVSHISDDAFWQVLELSTAPVFASHSSARALHDHPRNLTDDMIKAIAAHDGIVGITWFPEYVSKPHQIALEARARAIDLKALGLDPGGPGMPAIATLMRSCGSDMNAKYNVMMTEGLPMPTVGMIVEHVAHVAGLIGADRVCLGSDHGAVRFDIPGFEDCTKFPILTQALRDHGFSDTDVHNILGENVLRLMERVIGS